MLWDRPFLEQARETLQGLIDKLSFDAEEMPFTIYFDSVKAIESDKLRVSWSYLGKSRWASSIDVSAWQLVSRDFEEYLTLVIKRHVASNLANQIHRAFRLSGKPVE